MLITWCNDLNHLKFDINKSNDLVVDYMTSNKAVAPLLFVSNNGQKSLCFPLVTAVTGVEAATNVGRMCV